ncbi:nitroreductase [Methylophaga lonarensis MPL]|uniref:Nitroreductase n=1 Tax=Methylophaga lonarensis MPL TaxID=1286106 RepID=M7NYM2_9GAMM|nr:nitroreductase family protein [Methylophaga lonarensis]EMR12327.1 nitroreductase [Methylophaga lonarensis MPL]
MIHKPAQTAHEIAPIMANRWSGRAYDGNQPVSQEDIIKLCEAARWAPSCFGDAPWRFIVWNKFENASAWQKALDCLVPGNQEWAKDAPVLILAASVPNFTHNDKKNRWTGYDTGAASVSLCLQATALGLMSHQMGGFEADKLRSAFSIPEEISLWSMIAIGHALPESALSAEQAERELQPRQRRPLEDHFFTDGWQ